MNIVAKIKNLSLYPLAYAIVSAQSVAARMKVLGKKPIVRFEQPYQGQKILLLALYEKGRLREDIENLLITAKSLGMYVLAVNTLKVQNPDSLRDKVDCYIERPNFGRDFGSYKTGFLHIYKQRWEQDCKRLLMLNDSLFYSKANLATFLEQMITTDIEVLGATENHEIEHHLGSFCISFDQSILQQTRFRRFWARYSNTNVRPKVIMRGEMELSKTLRSCVSSQDQFAAHFSISWLANYLKSDQDVLYRVYDFCRASNLVDWQKPSLMAAVSRFMDKYIQIDLGLASLGENIEANIEAKKIFFFDGVETVVKGFEKSVEDLNVERFEERFLEEVQYDLMECFNVGSQIHQNNILLHYLGMPLIKNDLLYRGMFLIEDIDKMSKQLLLDERQNFLKLICSKPFGGNTLYGWKRAAFYRGLI